MIYSHTSSFSLKEPLISFGKLVDISRVHFEGTVMNTWRGKIGLSPGNQIVWVKR